MRIDRMFIVVLAGCFTPAPRPTLAPSDLDAIHRTDSGPTGAVGWHLDATAAIAYALEHSPVLSERSHLESIASARIGAASQLTNPEIRIGRSTDDTLLGPADRLSLALRLHPDAPWTIDARVAQARAGYETERAITAGARRALAAQIQKLYAQLAFTDVTIDLLDRQHGLSGARKRVLEEQMAHAAATRLDLALAAQDVVEIAATKANLEISRLAQRAELAALIGIPAGQTWTPTWDLQALWTLHVALDRRALVERALTSRPDIVAAATQVEAADANVHEEKTQRIPWIETLALERSERETTEWAIAATISIPLFSLHSGGIAVATATRARYRSLQGRLIERARREVDDAVDLVEATGRRARALQDGFEATNKEIETVIAHEKVSATSDPIKLSTLEERQVRARRAIADAVLAHRLAVIELERIAGGSP